MSVRPEDIANLCTLFSTSGKRTISLPQLRIEVFNAMPIDTNANAKQIIEEARKLGLIALRGNIFHITKLGREIGNKQMNIRTTLSENAKMTFIEKLYLNESDIHLDCASFLTYFRPDVEERTFIYDRDSNETADTQKWLLILSCLGVVHCTETKVFIETKYLDRVNRILAKSRECEENVVYIDWQERQNVGKVAEELAIEYEIDRLQSKGMNELVPLIRHISLVDKSAGYDVMSCRCTGVDPESPIYIEVKGTCDTIMKFIWSRNERRVASKMKANYWIYCYTEVNVDQHTAKGPYRIRNPINNLKAPKYQVEAIDLYIERTN
jgi:hypothetical protein